MRSPEKLPNAVVRPQEIITEYNDNRRITLSFAGIVNNQLAFLDYLVESGVEEAGTEEIRKSAMKIGERDLAWKKLSSDPDIKQKEDEWYAKLHLNGLRMLFGHRAMQRSTKVIKEQLFSTPNEPRIWSVPQVKYRGELPIVLGDQTKDAEHRLQEGINLQYERNPGFFLGMPMTVMALYEDRVVTLHAQSRTHVEDRDIWELDVRTDLRGPLLATTRTPSSHGVIAPQPHRLDSQKQ